MPLIQHLIRASAVAAVLAAAPASAAGDNNAAAPSHKSASADLRSCAKPAYPAAAVKARREGTVTLAFLVGADSKLLESKVENSSGHRDLDEATRAALTKCTFEAASQNGKPVQEWTHVKYVWSLK